MGRSKGCSDEAWARSSSADVERAPSSLLLACIEQKIALAQLRGNDTRQVNPIAVEVDQRPALATAVNRDIAEVLRCHFEIQLICPWSEIADPGLMIGAIDDEHISARGSGDS